MKPLNIKFFITGMHKLATGLKQNMNFIILIVQTTNFFHQKSGKNIKISIYEMYYVLK
jgi:hypothetical protein